MIVRGEFVSGYIMELRKHVGKRPIIQSGACVIVLDDMNRVMMLKRKDNGKWGLCGGSTELGETVEETAIREVKEETGLSVKDPVLFSVFSGEKMRYVYPNGDEVYNIAITYICRGYEGEIKPDNEECTQVKFFDLNDLPGKISGLAKTVLNKLLREYPIL